jgi:hypothetical protein
MNHHSRSRSTTSAPMMKAIVLPDLRGGGDV